MIAKISLVLSVGLYKDLSSEVKELTKVSSIGDVELVLTPSVASSCILFL